MPLNQTVGPVTVTALVDAEGPIEATREQIFPAATDEQWAAAAALDPTTKVGDGRWWLPFRCFAIRSGDGPVTLIDAGIGPSGSLADDWAPGPGRLPQAVAEAGIDPADVTTIVLTHLHNDHLGWAVPADSPFTEAQVIIQKADVEAYTENRELAGQYDRLIGPLRAEGRLEAVDGELSLSPHVRLVPTPGHTPGHQSVLVEDGEDSLLITGDLLVHPVQLLHPELAYQSEMDPQAARISRERMFEYVAARKAITATSHLGTAFLAYG
jgi:glyoxylase-like metal-dependent hydrolase (beta-lactamase superfamily II)